jgi:ketosteroid isomerase-like protein
MTMLLGIFLFVIIGIQTDVQTPPDADIAAIRSIEETFRTAWLKNDEKTIMSLLEPDASLYTGGRAPLNGTDSIRRYWFGPSDVVTTIESFDLEIEAVEGTADFATVTGSDVIRWSTVKKKGSDRKAFVSKGHFLAVYTKINSRWAMHKRFAAGKTEEIMDGVKK